MKGERELITRNVARLGLLTGGAISCSLLSNSYHTITHQHNIAEQTQTGHTHTHLASSLYSDRRGLMVIVLYCIEDLILRVVF